MNKMIKAVKNMFPEFDGQIYLVGGYIRDKLIDPRNEPKDIDIICDGDINVLIEMFKKMGYSTFLLKAQKCIYRIMKDDTYMDVSPIKGKTIYEDLSKRDFTVNSIAMDLRNNRIIDPFKGRNCIKSRIVNEVSEDSIIDDRVRILRGARLCIKYGMHFSLKTEKHIVEQCKYINECAHERILSEFMNILESDKNGAAFEFMDRFGILNKLLPYIDELKTVGKCKYHVEDAFTHMNAVYKLFNELSYKKIKLDGFDLKILCKKIGGISLKAYVGFAAFCHDIGKFKCFNKNADKVSFYKHDIVGADIMEGVCKDMMFPSLARKLVVNIVKAHMYPLMIYKSGAKNIKESFYKFFSKYGEYVPYILVVSFCDVYSTRLYFDPEGEKEKYREFIEKSFCEYGIYQKIIHDKLVSGNDVMEFTDIRGEKIGQVLQNINKLIYLDKLKNKSDIIKYLINL